MRMIETRLGQMRRSFALLWLMQRKQVGKICRQAAVSPALVTASLTSHRKIYSMKSGKYVPRRPWHAARIVYGGPQAMGVAAQGPREFGGSFEDATRPTVESILDRLRCDGRAGGVGFVSGCNIKDQGSRQYRRRPPEPAD